MAYPWSHPNQHLSHSFIFEYFMFLWNVMCITSSLKNVHARNWAQFTEYLLHPPKCLCNQNSGRWHCAFAEVERHSPPPLPPQILHVLQMCHIKGANLRPREADKVRHLKFRCPPKNQVLHVSASSEPWYNSKVWYLCSIYALDLLLLARIHLVLGKLWNQDSTLMIPH